MCPTRIKQIRLSKGITQKELAKMVGLSQAEVSRKENGRTSVNTHNLTVFATALGVKVSDLLEDTTPIISDRFNSS